MLQGDSCRAARSASSISRDGNIQTMAVELADRRKLEHDVWNKIGNGGDVFCSAAEHGHAVWRRRRRAGAGGGFHLPFFGSSLNVGALVEPLTSQMADYLGVPSGLMVKQVARKSDAAHGGPEGLRRDSQGRRRDHDEPCRTGIARCAPTRASRCR